MASILEPLVDLSHGIDGGLGMSAAVVSTFPPTSCGLATFASALSCGLERVGVSRLGIVRCVQEGESQDDGGVSLRWRPSPDGDVKEVVRFLNGHDVVFIQHEYGIFGADDGVAVLRVVDELDVPVIPTLHTVPSEPSPSQRRILESLVARSTATVVMTEAARRRLIEGFDVDPARIRNIPHGATLPPASATTGQGCRYALTWGLLGPGKGIEWVVDALAMAPDGLGDLTYRIVGRTHPKVMARDGNAYVDMLKRRASELGISARIVFDESYHSLESLLDIIAGAEFVVLPYDSQDQITSGVLVDAVTAGVPVIATAFPHAEELLSDGAGVIVPHRDPRALSKAISLLATDDTRRSQMASRAHELALIHEWETVALEYLRLARNGHVGAGRVMALDGREDA